MRSKLWTPAEAIDEITGAKLTIDYGHHEIHEGNHYKAGRADTSLAAEDTIELLFVTPNTTTWSHWTLTAQSTGEIIVQVYEGTAASNDGTAVTVWNRDRNSSNTATLTVTHTPTITADGTKMIERWIGGDGFKTSIGGEHRGDSEFILKQNTKYLVRLTAVGDAIKGAIGGDWYEYISK